MRDLQDTPPFPRPRYHQQYHHNYYHQCHYHRHHQHCHHHHSQMAVIVVGLLMTGSHAVHSDCHLHYPIDQLQQSLIPDRPLIPSDLHQPQNQHLTSSYSSYTLTWGYVLLIVHPYWPMVGALSLKILFVYHPGPPCPGLFRRCGKTALR